MHSSIFIGGPLHKKKTVTQLNISHQIIYRDKQQIVHLYKKIGSTNDSAKIFYHYVGPAKKNQDGEWIPVDN